MVRSIWKISNQFIKLCGNNKISTDSSSKNFFKVYNSNFIILHEYIGCMFYVYNGNKFKKIIINEDNVGLLLSTLIITRYNNGSIHVNKKKKKK